MKYRIPVGKCPCCNHIIAYSNNSKLKRNIVIKKVSDSFDGATILCAKCKTMLSIVEKTTTVQNYVSVPIIKFI